VSSSQGGVRSSIFAVVVDDEQSVQVLIYQRADSATNYVGLITRGNNRGDPPLLGWFLNRLKKAAYLPESAMKKQQVNPD
jgi:hypothetical protein